MNQGYFGKSKTIVVFHSNFLLRVLILNTSNHAVSSQNLNSAFQMLRNQLRLMVVS